MNPLRPQSDAEKGNGICHGDLQTSGQVFSSHKNIHQVPGASVKTIQRDLGWAGSLGTAQGHCSTQVHGVHKGLFQHEWAQKIPQDAGT